MNSFEILVNSYLLEKGRIGLIIIGIVVAAIVALTIIFSKKSLSNPEVHNDITASVHNDKMPVDDITD